MFIYYKINNKCIQEVHINVHFENKCFSPYTSDEPLYFSPIKVPGSTMIIREIPKRKNCHQVKKNFQEKNSMIFDMLFHCSNTINNSLILKINKKKSK